MPTDGDPLAIATALRAQVAEHGVPSSVRTHVLITHTHGVPLYAVATVITFLDGATHDIHWRTCMTPAAADQLARTRNKQLRKLLTKKV